MPPERAPASAAPTRFGWATCSAPGARAYDATFGRLLAGLYQACARDLARRMPSGAEHIIDLGAGPGGLVVVLAGTFPTSRITAVDLDPGMAALARQRIQRVGIDARARVTVGDVAALPLPDRSVDLVTSTFSVHHWPEPRIGFAEVHRVLRPGGRAIIYDLPDWWGRWETRAPALLDGARGAGFGSIAHGTLHWPGPVGFGSIAHGTLHWPGPVGFVQLVEATR